MTAYPAMLDVPRELVLAVSTLLAAERRVRGTRWRSRALSCFKQALFVVVRFRKREDLTVLGADAVSDWAPAWCRIDRGLLAWELPCDDTLTHRRLLAVTGAHNEPALDNWTWAGHGSGVPPLTRYLLHAAKLRYQHHVLRATCPAYARSSPVSSAAAAY